MRRRALTIGCKLLTPLGREGEALGAERTEVCWLLAPGSWLLTSKLITVTLITDYFRAAFLALVQPDRAS